MNIYYIHIEESEVENIDWPLWTVYKEWKQGDLSTGSDYDIDNLTLGIL